MIRFRVTHKNVRLISCLWLICVVVGCSTLTIPTKLNLGRNSKQASNQRLWRPDLSVLAYAEFDGPLVTIRNVRNCRYRSDEDYDVRHYDLEFNLDDVRTVDYVIVPFSNAPIIAHTMVSFGLKDGQHFLISVEGRLEQGENYSTTKGFGKDFELIYLIGDERDLIPLRTDVRKVDVYLYPGKATPDQVQNLLVDMLHRANSLSIDPEYYNTLNNNCTTNLVNHINHLKPGAIPFDWRVLLPGKSDKLAYELGLLDIEGSFEDAQRAAHINTLVEIFRNDPNFSNRIRRKPDSKLNQ